MEDCEVNLKKIVAALDLSAYAETTFMHALALARSLQAELIILNIINISGLQSLDLVASQGFPVSKEDYIQKTKRERIRIFEETYLSRTEGIAAKIELRVGVPFEEIVKFLRKEKADMVVMGTKGRTDLAGVLFGSTAEKVFRHSPCAVVSVRGPRHCRLPE